MPTKPAKPKAFPEQLALQFELPFLSSQQTPGLKAGNPRARLVQFGSKIVEYQLKRSRRRTIGFVVDERGLTVTAPAWVSVSQIEDAVREKQRWILAKLSEAQALSKAIVRVNWTDGGKMPYLGDMLTLRIVPAETRSEAVQHITDLAELRISLPLAASHQQIKDRVQGWLQSEARRIFGERLELFGNRLGVAHRTYRLSSAATRWGSCSADGKILLNWRLVHFPMSSIDYVVAHELAHLREMNHGPRFWQTVAQILPGFEAAREHLNNPPKELLPVF
jgi:predicted metal-dependent hydrolase